MKINHFRELRVYQLAIHLQQEIFALSKSFPAEERYSLTDQIRRSSRSVGANLAELGESEAIQRISPASLRIPMPKQERLGTGLTQLTSANTLTRPPGIRFGNRSNPSDACLAR